MDQFLSDISVLGPRGAELSRKSISVNDPLRFRVRARVRAPAARCAARPPRLWAVTSVSHRCLHPARLARRSSVRC